MVSLQALRSKRAAAAVAATPTRSVGLRNRVVMTTCAAIATGLLLGLPVVSHADDAMHVGNRDAPTQWRIQNDVVASDTKKDAASHRFDPMHALLPNTRSFVVRRGIQSYRVWLYTPESAPSSHASMPLLVLLDGNAMFPIALQAARLQQRLIGPLVIAAIAPDDENLFDEAARYRDFTTAAATDAWGVPTFAALHAHDAATQTTRPSQATSDIAGSVRVPTGGAADFRALIRNTILPEIQRRAAIDPARTTLFGHSLGGFFVLDTVLHDRCLFDRYIAASPSLWWNDRQLLQDAHAPAVADCGPRPVMLQVGGAEQSVAPHASAARIERVTHAAMLDNITAMAGVLKQTPSAYAPEGPRVYPNGNHVSYLPAALSDAVQDAAKIRTPPTAP